MDFGRIDLRMKVRVDEMFMCPFSPLPLRSSSHSSVAKTVLFTELAPGLTVQAVVEWVLATPVQFGCGARFYRSVYYQYGNATGLDGMVSWVVVIRTFVSCAPVRPSTSGPNNFSKMN